MNRLAIVYRVVQVVLTFLAFDVEPTERATPREVSLDAWLSLSCNVSVHFYGVFTLSIARLLLIAISHVICQVWVHGLAWTTVGDKR